MSMYYHESAGDNVWDYYFEPVASYRAGAHTLGGRPVRVFVAASKAFANGSSVGESSTGKSSAGKSSLGIGAGRSSALRSARISPSTTDASARAQQRVRIARLVRRFLRVRPAVRAEAARLLHPLKQQGSAALLGIALVEVYLNLNRTIKPNLNPNLNLNLNLDRTCSS